MFEELFKSTEVSGNTSASAEQTGIDLSFFMSEKSKIEPSDSEIEAKTKKKKTSIKTINENEILGKINNPVPGSSVAEVDYASTYNETNNLIRGAIIQADELASEVKQDIDKIRASSTLKSKYTYLTNLTSTAGNLISTKIAAIKELNASITQAHNLELNRMKALKLNEQKENDDMRMMDIYSAFINTPVGSYSAPAAPSIQDLTLGVNAANPNVSGIEMVAQNSNGPLTAEQNRMRMENNPNIETVVRFDQSTGMRSFDVIDKNTGMSIPNYPRPDAFLLEDTTIDVNMGIARNRNINSVWPLIIEGSNSMVINEY
mgnify:FL=1